MQRIPLNTDKTPACKHWKDYSGECLTPMFGIKIPQGFIVIDTDDYKTEGLKEQIEKALGCSLDWSMAHLQTTKNGGNHYGFTVDPSVELTQGANLLGIEGFDTRCAGAGYIASGEGYQVNEAECVTELFDEMFLPELPAAAVEVLRKANGSKVNGSKVNSSESECLDLAEVVRKDNVEVLNSDGSALSAKQIRDVINRLPANVGADNDSWYTIAAGLKTQLLAMGKSKEELDHRGSWGYKVLDSFSAKRGGYSKEVEAKNFSRWCSFKLEGKKDLITFASVVALAGGVKPVKTNEQTGKAELVECDLADRYVMDATGKYVEIKTKAVYTKAAFDAKHATDTPTNSKGNHIKPSTFVNDKITVVVDTLYMPKFPDVFQIGGVDYLNIYKPVVHDSYQGGSGIMDAVKGHIAHLIADEREQEILFNYLAHNIQRKGEKITWSIILQGVQGDGKSFFAEMMTGLLGESNVRIMNASTLESSFTGWASGQCFTVIEELKIDNFKKYEIVNRMKPYIANTTVEQVRKGKDPRTIPNTTNYLCLTNYQDSVPVDENDRRYCPIFSRWQNGNDIRDFIEQNPRYYPDLYDLMRNNIPELYDEFMKVKIPDWFDREKRAPMTTAKGTMTEYSKSEEQIAVEDALEEFGNGATVEGCLNVTQLTDAVKCYVLAEDDQDRFEYYPKGRTLGKILTSLGYGVAKRVKIDGKTCVVRCLK